MAAASRSHVAHTSNNHYIRVALVTDARSATISTTSRLMNATGGSTTLLALDTSRVRVEPHLLSPQLPANNEDTYRVMVGGAASREEAEENAKEIKRASGEESQVAFDTETKTWGLMVGAKRPREEAEELRARLEIAGMDATIPDFLNGSPIPSTGNSGIRLASRSSLPSRELIAFSPTAGRLFNSSAPIAFASYDEKNAPVRFNDRPYRGRIEVFTNSRGTLTVVNELGLEARGLSCPGSTESPGRRRAHLCTPKSRTVYVAGI